VLALYLLYQHLLYVVATWLLPASKLVCNTACRQTDDSTHQLLSLLLTIKSRYTCCVIFPLSCVIFPLSFVIMTGGGGGLKQKTDDYNWVWAKFLDPTDDAYDVENYSGDDIWKDPTREFYKKGYDKRQFKLSLSRLVKKLREERRFACLQ
jgi:hypothetical protein